jgi:hypothetical protein
MANNFFPGKPKNPRKRVILEAVLQRDLRTCQMCGSTEVDKCLNDGRPVYLRVIPILQSDIAGQFEEDKLRTVCSSCASGIQAVRNRARKESRTQLPERKGCIQLLTDIRRATVEDQKAVADWLFNHFKKGGTADE